MVSPIFFEQADLGFQEVDMAFLVRQQLFEQFHRDDVAGVMTRCRATSCRPCGHHIRRRDRLPGHFLDILDRCAAAPASAGLDVLKKDDPSDETIGVMHLFNGFRTFLLGKLGIAPIFQKPIMNPILIDRTEFEKQRLVKPLDRFFCRLSMSALLFSSVEFFQALT